MDHNTKILEYVLKHGQFDVPQFLGGYDALPFTHEEYLRYIQELSDQNIVAENLSLYDDESPRPVITILIRRFEVDGNKFVWRHLEMGEDVDQLMTSKFHSRNWPGEIN
jgi:hypothetical protein